jgi:hypothetical protein
MAISICKLVLLLTVLAVAFGQQICLQQECAQQVKACGDDCVQLMGKCMFSCTMGSLGCLQKCMGDSAPAQGLLECAFNKCILL